MAHTHKFAAAASFVAAVSMATTPVFAADIPVSHSHSSIAPAAAYDADAGNAQNHRYYRYRPYRHRHVSTGDVLAGVLIIGGIAAIASAASKDRDERYRDRDYRDRPYDYRERRGDSRYDNSRGIDRAVSMCVDRIERDVRVDSVDGVDRTGEGWRVTGTLYNGEGFTCRIGEDGRIDDVDYGGGLARNGTLREPVEDNQHSDDRYAAAWRDLNNQAQPRPMVQDAGGPQPAYPGGPIDGDLEADDAGDDRYRIAVAPAN
ncbi:hypothetical protein IM511_02200 [Erythrobacteraceae bacterium E2-1 Yellow Sea]|nr:hypothetical protein [Erythrobacteraceae bacterium E2-1 Yellow Sea]